MTCSLTPVTRNKSSLDLILCAFWIRSLLGDYMHCEHNNHTEVSNINSCKKYQQHTVIYWEQNLMCKLTGGPGFPLIPGGPGKPRAPWKKKAIKCTRKLLCLLEAINCYILTPEAGFKKNSSGWKLSSNIQLSSKEFPQDVLFQWLLMY